MSIVEKNEGAEPSRATAPLKNENLYDFNIPFINKTGNQDAKTFLNLLAEGEEVTFQTFSDKKGCSHAELVRVLHGTLEQHYSYLKELNEKGAGIFITVNATDLKGRTVQNITKVRAFFVDLDGAPLAPVLDAPMSPHMVIESSQGRFHAYWLIEGAPLETFSDVQKALIQRFSADRAVHDIPRVMRLPGFFHHKKEPSLVRIIEHANMLPYKYDDFLEKFQIHLLGAINTKGPQLGLAHDAILQELDRRGMIKRQMPSKPGGWEIICPYVHLRTTGDQGTAYFEANTNGYKGPGFKCQHSHCEGRGVKDLKEYLGIVLESKEEWENPIPLKEELHPVAPFQEEMLPTTLRSWIMDISERMQVPPDFLAAACVVILGSLIGRKVGIFPKANDDWLVIPNLWGAVVGRPSLLKSPAIAEMMKPLEELVEKAIGNYQEDGQIYEQEEMWFEARKAAQKAEMKQAARKKSTPTDLPQLDPIKPLTKPRLKRYKTEDGTVEKIGELLLENPQGILIHRDELVGFLKSLDKPGREGDRAFFLESWNGNGSFTVDRIGRGTLHIPALCLSIIGGIQPGPLGLYIHQAATGGAGDDGLLQRFQILVWPDAPKTWKNIDRVPDSIVREQAYQVFQRLDGFEPFEPSPNQVFETYTLHFTSDAQAQFDEWRTHLEQRLRCGDLNPALESHLAKYRSLIPALALIFYLVETVGEGRNPIAIDLQSIRRALEWGHYLETHAKRLYASGEDPHMESARTLLERIQRGDLPNGFSPRDVYHGRHWSKLDTADKVNNAIKILEDFGWVKAEIIKTPGRSSMRIIIHPQLRSKQARG